MVYRMISTDMKQRALYLLLKEGWGIDQITTALGLHSRTIERWEHHYENRGKKMAFWFFQGSIYQEWKSTGSLLWVDGKRSHRTLSNLTRSNIILIVAGSGKSILWFVHS